ncbi:hypothetical protein IE077_000616 [Cardiosporidium cionae]|uniref:H(+)-exporting diphosphatase n=1 Tax=Cardiosporidium cionae TaxID=476202 RepID=A0ABQ7JEH1_9APIC|nr:hypothetical protein IE077_000616 [Cardiosporidium cionae]|eukprot:KAF8822412.1 hypothetical protein IE077_000616 [Cardiosporidium cionae]
MIQASKANLITSFHAGSIAVQYLEIQYCLLVLHRLASVAGLLGAFSTTALVSITAALPQNPVALIVFIVMTGSALGLMLIVLLVSTLTTMWGTGLALRGDGPESVDKAVKNMEAAVNCSFRAFNLGLICFLLSAVLSSWMIFPFEIGITVTIIIGFASLRMSEAGIKIMNTLLPRETTSGILHGNPFRRDMALTRGYNKSLIQEC